MSLEGMCWIGMDLFSKKRGTFLLELALVTMLIALAAGFAAPAFMDWQKEMKLDAAAAEVSAIIRDTQTAVRNADQHLPYGSERLDLYFVNQGDRIQYYTLRGANVVRPKGYLPAGIRLYKDMILKFRKDGFAGTNDEYTVTLMTKDKKYRRLVVLAMYTGRVRIQKE